MNRILSFNDIKHVNRQYHVQGVLISQPFFFTSNSQFTVFGFIIQDLDQNKIECVAFGSAATKLSKIMLNINDIYLITSAQAINNKKYIKTKHSFKLQLTDDTEITKLKTAEYLKNNKIYVAVKGSNKKTKNNQLSIKNWLNKKSFK